MVALPWLWKLLWNILISGKVNIDSAFIRLNAVCQAHLIAESFYGWFNLLYVVNTMMPFANYNV